MHDLIPFVARTLGAETVHTVNARDLYAYLELTGENYARWIARAIKRANLLENIDFVVFFQVEENPKGGRPASEYHLTFDAAKHVAMMSSAEKGHDVRAWFIAKEKELHASQYREIPQVRDPAIQMLIDLAVRLDEARTLAAEANTKATLALASQQWLTIREYTFLHSLERQLPESAKKAYGTYLTGYCLQHGIPVREMAIADRPYRSEHAYHVETIAKTLPAWLIRRESQPPLAIVPS